MTHTDVAISNVFYDAAARRFQANAILGGSPARKVQISAPGHQSWSFAQIATALTGVARTLGKAKA